MRSQETLQLPFLIQVIKSPQAFPYVLFGSYTQTCCSAISAFQLLSWIQATRLRSAFLVRFCTLQWPQYSSPMSRVVPPGFPQLFRFTA